MTGSIGVPCSDTARYTAFADSLANLDKPPGMRVRFAVSSWRHKARNQLVEWMLEAGEDWLLFLDDDHVFAPDLLTRLLSHEKDIVGALCLRRDEPYGPFAFHERLDDGCLQPINLHNRGEWLVPVAAVGTGAMLIRRRVFELLPEPWFRVEQDSGEDMIFCRDAIEAGLEIYCDLGAPVGHLTTAVVWPARSENEWKVGFVISDETRILRDLPPPDPYKA